MGCVQRVGCGSDQGVQNLLLRRVVVVVVVVVFVFRFFWVVCWWFNDTKEGQDETPKNCIKLARITDTPVDSPLADRTYEYGLDAQGRKQRQQVT